MAENNKPKMVGGSNADDIVRDQFIGIALRELIKQQIANKDTGKYALAADHAVRYANAVMESRARTFKTTVSAGGRGVPIAPVPVQTVPADDKPLGEIADELEKFPVKEELPKNPVPSIANQIGQNLPALAEVK